MVPGKDRCQSLGQWTRVSLHPAMSIYTLILKRSSPIIRTYTQIAKAWRGARENLLHPRPSTSTKYSTEYGHTGIRTSSFQKKIRKKHHSSQREITWATTPEKRTREFAVTNLYPRLLYTFSDIVVFVLKNPRLMAPSTYFLARTNVHLGPLRTSSSD